jgi:hypothetical protein
MRSTGFATILASYIENASFLAFRKLSDKIFCKNAIGGGVIHRILGVG